ncbi:MAG TPA: glycoside hydrolase family 97 N-terminal domain-containing protein, partial [Flavisolibacter sp.]|nr:glycoside hydrolase family 97 N-terminal domain-containing protein [Flavisolibacter sp.]
MRILSLTILCFFYNTATAQKAKQYELSSPDRRTKVTVQAGQELSWSVVQENTIVLQPSAIALQLSNGEVLGKDVQVKKATPSSANNTIQATLYKKATINDQYNQLLLQCKGDWGIIFRAYNDGVAYRFFTAKKDSITVQNETAGFRFEKDHKSYFPYVREPRTLNDKFQTSFEALYDEVPISQFAKDTLAFLPVLIDLGQEKKAVIVESDLENYPGMYVKGGSANTLSGVFAPYPLQVEIGGFNKLNQVVTRRAGYIAKVPGVQQFPWRAVIISSSDKELLNNDMVY